MFMEKGGWKLVTIVMLSLLLNSEDMGLLSTLTSP